VGGRCTEVNWPLLGLTLVAHPLLGPTTILQNKFMNCPCRGPGWLKERFSWGGMRMDKIALTEVIEELRRELDKAVNKATGPGVRFELEDVTLETEVSVTREIGGKAGGGLSFWISTNAEASVNQGSTATQRLVLKLRPFVQDAQGQRQPTQFSR
jgi:Trypsin-co-occurring domain 2